MADKRYHVYIMASICGTLYTAVCGPLYERIMQHKSGEGSFFTRRYKCDRLFYYEEFRFVRRVLRREKEITGWKRFKKVVMIQSVNPSWMDLAKDWGTLVDPSALGRDPSLRRKERGSSQDDSFNLIHRSQAARGGK